MTDVNASMSTLTVIRVEPGHDEPEGGSFVEISARPTGGFEFAGMVMLQGMDVEPGSATSIKGSAGGGMVYSSADEAEAAAIEWAAEQGAETLYVLVPTAPLAG